jgi:anti-sigma B factor antagonist
MSVQRRFNHHRAVVAVSGEVDLATVPELRAALEDALDSGADELWLDLGATTFMDSSGLHAVLDSQARATALGRHMAIVLPAGPVRRLFELTGYRERLAVHDALPAEE